MSDLAPLPDRLAFLFDGAGHAVKDAPPVPPGSPPRGGFSWLHLRRDAEGTRAALDACDLDGFVVEALMAEETRPRCTVHGDGALVNLRGVNLNPGAEPEDMVSIRLWVEAERVIGIWIRPLRAVRDILEAADRGQAPTTPGAFVARLALRLADRAEPSVAALNERIDDLEDLVLDERASIPRLDLSDLRREAIILRRYMLPQRDALTTLEIEDLPWLTADDRSRLREAAERVFRLGEDLDAIRDRAQVVHDQIMDRRAERMNGQMLILSVVAAIFLPLGLLTGLLGINVGGVPGTESPYAFWWVCAALVALTGGLVWLFRHLGMFR
ncbi:zinc transporter ZntB [Roseobacter sp. HKCCA0434]|uniref:zinc transporter ZntB n=1 Tax=Roseobacter sp. HKCCA0434 TaxID=3079297 RepID=UPI002905DD1F|nr:zinc transporter ZntB [Roseobacter sp. HKCCA0434]